MPTSNTQSFINRGWPLSEAEANMKHTKHGKLA
jgi:hypothetical protein